MANYNKNWLTFEQFKEKFQIVPVEEYPNKVLKAIPEPKVSVHIITYQHVNYIRQAIDSVLMQQTDFPFEIIISDDESTDGTREICMEYAEKYPEKIRLLLHQRENNIKIFGKPSHLYQYAYNLFQLRGEYIAGLSGDDLWCDKNKLQLQFDMLSSNVNYSLCFTDYIVIGSNSDVINFNPLKEEDKKGLTLYDLLSEIRMPQTQTVMYRKSELLNKLPDVFLQSLNEDKFLFTLCLKKGDAAYLDFKSAKYRKHTDGINSMIEYHRKLLNALKTNLNIQTILKGKEEKRAHRKHIKKQFLDLFFIYLQKHMYKDFLLLNVRLIRHSLLLFFYAYYKLIKSRIKNLIK